MNHPMSSENGDDLLGNNKGNNNRKPDPRKARPERRQQRSVGLPMTVWKALDQLADEHDAPVSRLIEQAVRHYLATLNNTQG